MIGEEGELRLRLALRRWIEEAAGSFLVTERWFGDKTRPIAATTVADLALAAVDDERYALCFVEVVFRDGGTGTYFVPLALTRCPPPDVPRLTTLDADGAWYVLDAVALPRGRAWLLDRLAADATLPAERGAFVWRQTDLLAPHLAVAQTDGSRLGTAEQSNTSVVYGASLILKMFRKVEPGVNPELEIARFLTVETDFRHVPLLAGELSYVGTEGEPVALGLMQTFVPNVGDGWSYTLDLLASLPAGADFANAYRPLARRLGERTGQLHGALAGATTDPAFAPQPIDDDDVAGWAESFRAALAHTTEALRAHVDLVPAALEDQVRAFFAAQDILETQTGGFARLRGTTKTRVHGDLHLGQTLRTPTEDVVFLDFEGEPARPLAERRAKTSPLKDVAGMLRSFAYVRGTLERADRTGAGGAHDLPELLAWERAARDAFVDGYLAETADRGATFLPANRAAFDAALAAWELDKAIYEIAYELNNRPDWLAIPLGAVLR